MCVDTETGCVCPACRCMECIGERINIMGAERLNRMLMRVMSGQSEGRCWIQRCEMGKNPVSECQCECQRYQVVSAALT